MQSARNVVKETLQSFFEGEEKKSIEYDEVRSDAVEIGSAVTTNKPEHLVQSDGCGVAPIIGISYKCTECKAFDICGMCAAEKDHEHCMSKILRRLPSERLESNQLIKSKQHQVASTESLEPAAINQTLSEQIELLVQ